MNDVSVRPLHSSDDMALLTSLIHSAYAPHAAAGLRYWGTHQSIEDTAKRFASGQAFVAELAGELVGTITLRGPQPDSPVALYRNPEVWSFVQFAVAPSSKGRGVGKALHEHVLASAGSVGGQLMAIDTAAPAAALIAKYRSWGYLICGLCDWRPHTNYLSVVMSRSITPVASGKNAP
jgi:GNAT superfamily N-acetyltransferase